MAFCASVKNGLSSVIVRVRFQALTDLHAVAVQLVPDRPGLLAGAVSGQVLFQKRRCILQASAPGFLAGDSYHGKRQESSGGRAVFRRRAFF
jgi:hypothetical protein